MATTRQLAQKRLAKVKETIKGEKAFGAGVQNYKNKAESPFARPFVKGGVGGS